MKETSEPAIAPARASSPPMKETSEPAIAPARASSHRAASSKEADARELRRSTSYSSVEGRPLSFSDRRTARLPRPKKDQLQRKRTAMRLEDFSRKRFRPAAVAARPVPVLGAF